MADGGENDNMGVSSMLKEVQELAEKFKVEEDEQYISPYAHLEKATVLQEARIFHDPNQVRENPRKCCTVIAQLLHLQNTGQFLSGVEATDVFFGVTKLFMSDDASLRRMVYLFIKDVAETCNPDDVIIVTSCLTKDMTCDVDLYRGNALRVLVRIVDAAMLGAIERYVKQAIVDASGQVSSSALVSATHLFNSSPECAAVVRRWISETQEATSSSNEMVQFHAIQLLYQIKQHDKLAVNKLVTQFSQRNTLRSPLALVLLVRYTSKLLQDDAAEGRSPTIQDGSQTTKNGYAFLEASLRHKSELVVYEAARAICSLPNAEPQDLNPAVSVLQLFLSSPKPAVRYASIRTLAAVANVHPRTVSKCNEDLEALIGGSNRSIATLAITTLLKTGSENSIDRLLKQISAFLTDIADEYKITVVRSIQKLCLTYPSKHRVLVGFLSNFLREEGGFDFKRSIVSSIVSLIRSVPETTESSLLQLCEFIEDCEFTMLSTQILHLLGELGPTTSAPARYIRFIYNRVILENSAVRAAAVSALTKFAASCPSLRTSIWTLLKRSLADEDDETRDRAAIAVAVLEQAMLDFPYVAPSGEITEHEDVQPDQPQEGDTAAFLFLDSLPMNFDKLERSMKLYMASPATMNSPEPIVLDALPIVEDSEVHVTVGNVPVGMNDMNGIMDEPEVKKEIVDPAAAVYAIPELAALGRVFRSSAPVPLTELETEYVVLCTKHIFENHVVLQFSVQNTIEEQRLDNVTVLVDDTDTDLYTASGEVAVDGIKYGETKNCFTVLERNTELALMVSHFNCELRFNVVQVDPATGEEEGDSFEEEYPLEDLEIATNDYMAKVSAGDFRKMWESVGAENEVLEKYALQFSKMEDAISAVMDFVGMQPCDGTATIKPGNIGGVKPHMLHLSGIFMGSQQVLVRAQIGFQNADNVNAGVILKIAVRSNDGTISRVVADCIR